MKYIVFFLSLFISINLNAQFSKAVVSVRGVTISDVDQTPVQGSIKVFDLETHKIVVRAKSTGKYFVTGLKPGKSYEFAVSGKGYFYQSFVVNIPNTDKYAEFSKDFALKPMAPGAKIPLKIIPFDLHKTKLRAGSDYVLEDIVNIMKGNRRTTFEIVVFPENDQDPSEAKRISEERANAILTYLQENKVRSEISVILQSQCDPENPKPTKKRAKGKRYKGSVYIVVKDLG